ncbi:hypothetical protein [Clostridium sp. M14]|uniref:hypothetical protein n=1 Tax=Clostridium sp. M14 TaxID=2716311 RepID=UPI0013EE9E0F|nr:hypothetical protein [Clostridium sp. M14]MBZ9693373.1 hypothetical protein [Clostridium sp. M14]
MNKKEFKGYWNSLTLGEVKDQYLHLEEIIQIAKNSIKKHSIKLQNLDTESKYYISELQELSDNLKMSLSNIKSSTKNLELLKPILEQKEIEGINQEEYEKYMQDNKNNIKVLIKAIEDRKQEIIKEGYKIVVRVNGEDKVIELSEKQIADLYNTMLKELVWMIKDRVGDVTEVYNLCENNNRGFDCNIKGNKGGIRINTILAGGYNIQKLHYRTLVWKTA